MSAADNRHIRELEMRCATLEQAVLIQEKRVWSLDMLQKLERGDFMGGASEPEKARTRELLEGNLRVSRETLDRLARDLGYETPSVFKLLDPSFCYGATAVEVPEVLSKQLERIDAREREAGTSYIAAMFRDLKTRHDDFLADVQEQVSRDVELHAIFSALTVGD